MAFKGTSRRETRTWDVISQNQTMPSLEGQGLIMSDFKFGVIMIAIAFLLVTLCFFASSASAALPPEQEKILTIELYEMEHKAPPENLLSGEEKAKYYVAVMACQALGLLQHEVTVLRYQLTDMNLEVIDKKSIIYKSLSTRFAEQEFISDKLIATAIKNNFEIPSRTINELAKISGDTPPMVTRRAVATACVDGINKSLTSHLKKTRYSL